MATPSVLTVPSMYGDGILYSGPSAYGSELATQPVDLQVDFQAAPSGGVIVDANTFTTSGNVLEGIRSKDAAFVLTVGTAFEIEIRGTTTSNGITLGSLGNSGNEYGSGFGVHRFVSLNNRLWIRQNSAGTTTITHLSIRPLTQGSDFEFTRATTGTRINEDGYIEDVPYNLLRHSESILSTTNWAVIGATTELGYSDPQGTLNAVKVTPTSNDPYIYGNMQNLSYKTYTGSIYVKGSAAADGLSIRLWLIRDNLEFLYEDYTLTTEWQRLEITKTFNTAIQNQAYLRIDSPNSNPPLTGIETFLWGAQVVAGSEPKNYLPTTDRVNLPRLNYPVYGGCPSLLMEPQRTNLFPYSNDYTQSNWTKSNVTITENAGISPENLNNASKMIASANASFNYIYDPLTGGSSQYTISAFVKADGRNIVWLYTQSVSTNGIIYFDLSDESMQIVAGTAGTPTGTITSFPNGWYRITSTSHTFTLSSGSGIGISDAKGSLVTTTDGTNGVLIYGLQIEAGSYPTSLMHTSGAAFTRNQDVAVNAGLGTTDTFNDSEGVLYGELRFNKTSPGNYIGIDDGTTSNRIIIGAEGGNIRVYSPGFTFSVNNLPMFGVNKIAFSWQTNLRKLFINGIKLGENTGAYTGPTGLNQLAFDSGSASQIFDGEAKAVAVYKTALTDTELANLTSYNNHDLFIPYRSRMQMISADQELQCTEHDITRFL